VSKKNTDKNPHVILIEFFLRHRVWVLLAVALVTVTAAIFAAKVQFSNSIEMWFLEDDPELQVYDEFSEWFGGDEIAVIGVVADDVFSRNVLEVIERLTHAAEKAPHVLSVRSLTSEAVRTLLDEIPDAGLQALREEALASNLMRGWLVSADASATPVLVEMEREGNTVTGKASLVKALREIVEQEQARTPEAELFLSGTPVLDEAFFRYNNRDVSLLIPLSIVLVLAAGLAAFRRISAAFLMFSVVVLAVVWVIGLMGVMGLNMSILSTALPPLLLAIGVANSVHVLNEYYRRRATSGLAKERAIVESMAHLLMPCTCTSLTTAFGLLSLTISPMRPVREFGILAAVGVLFAYLLSMVFLPVLLGLLPAPSALPSEKLQSRALDRLLTRIARPRISFARGLVALCAVLLAISVWLMFQLHVGVYALSWFPDDDQVVVDIQRADRELGGSSSLEFLVKAPDGGLAEPAVLLRLYQFERWLESNVPGVTGAISIADLLGDPPTDLSRHEIELQLATLREINGDDVRRLVQSDNSIGRITARIRLDQMPEVVDAFGEIDHQLDTMIGGHSVEVKMTGYVRLMGRMEDYLITSQLRSFVLAFSVITLLMVVFLRSWRLGLFAMIPNLLPVLMGLGTMALLGISLNPGTIMIGAIALGLVVDDTVYFLVTLRRKLGGGSNLEEAIADTVQTAGRPIIITSLILIIGFGVLSFGSFNPNIQFGIVSALVIGFALLCDLLLLPAVLKIVKPGFLGS
jgi:predicted RND superfamily exporter protein